MDDKFHVEITVSKYGSVDSKVIDNEFGDEYYPVNVETEYGSYVAEVKEGYREILEKVASNCFSDEYFIYPQSNRLAALIDEKYGETPEQREERMRLARERRERAIQRMRERHAERLARRQAQNDANSNNDGGN